MISLKVNVKNLIKSMKINVPNKPAIAISNLILGAQDSTIKKCKELTLKFT